MPYHPAPGQNQILGLNASEQSLWSFYTDGTEIIVRPWGLTFSVYRVSNYMFWAHERRAHLAAMLHVYVQLSYLEWSSLYQLAWMLRARF